MKAPRVTLDQWRTLQAVVDQGGFAQAADVLHRSQSSVSYTVARMQEQLGVPLLRIDGRKAVLLERGGDEVRRRRLLVRQLGVGVEVSPEGEELGDEVVDDTQQRRGEGSSHGGATLPTSTAGDVEVPTG